MRFSTFNALLFVLQLSIARSFLSRGLPSQSVRTVSPLSMSTTLPAEMPGQTLPFGFFDPLGLSSRVSEKRVKLWREAELKHGRICMLAAAGMLFAESFDRSPLFDGRVMGISINHFQQVNSLMPSFWFLILLSIASVELNSIQRGWQSPSETPRSATAMLKDDYIPGDLSFDPLNLMPLAPTRYSEITPKFVNMRNKELNNGRLAMIGVAGIVAQELVDHMKIIDHLAMFGLRPSVVIDAVV